MAFAAPAGLPTCGRRYRLDALALFALRLSDGVEAVRSEKLRRLAVELLLGLSHNPPLDGNVCGFQGFLLLTAEFISLPLVLQPDFPGEDLAVPGSLVRNEPHRLSWNEGDREIPLDAEPATIFGNDELAVFRASYKEIPIILHAPELKFDLTKFSLAAAPHRSGCGSAHHRYRADFTGYG